MADWTTIADANLDPGAPARSIDAKALRDNPIAIAEGAVGAPRVVDAALNEGYPKVYQSGTFSGVNFVSLQAEQGLKWIRCIFQWSQDPGSNGNLRMRFLRSGVDYSAAAYRYSTQEFYASATFNTNINVTQFELCSTVNQANNYVNGAVIDIHAPGRSDETAASWRGTFQNGSANTATFVGGGITNTVDATTDGLYLFSTNAMSGEYLLIGE